MIELKDLAGRHILDAVDFSEENSEYGDSASVCRFRLDGVVYVAKEDPVDGYRSCMDELTVDQSGNMSNVFPPVEVVAVHFEDGIGVYDHSSDALRLICSKNGLTVLTVGTKNTDDYYPCFIAEYRPENMPVNK